tara:strand:+ start:200 stop:1486 length:1287 start_codon:yes stop_codon:yes gene_type:complete
MVGQESIDIIIDGAKYQAKPMSNLRSVLIEYGVREHGVCHNEKIISPGKCDLCLVKIGDSVLRSCEVFITTKLEVSTRDDELSQSKINSFQLLVDNHKTDCERCHQSGVCKLQDFSRNYNQSFAATNTNDDKSRIEPLARDYHLDHDRCVSCSLCVDFSQKVEKDGLFRKSSRGKYTRVAHDPIKVSEIDLSLYRDLCPTGAIAHKSDSRLGAKGSWVDLVCPGCDRNCLLSVRTIDKRFLDIRSVELGKSCEIGYEWWRSLDLWRSKPISQIELSDQKVKAISSWIVYLSLDMNTFEIELWLKILKENNLQAKLLSPVPEDYARQLGPDGKLRSIDPRLEHLELVETIEPGEQGVVLLEPVWGYSESFYQESSSACQLLCVVTHMGVESECVELQVERNTWMNPNLLPTRQTTKIQVIIESLISRNI